MTDRELLELAAIAIGRCVTGWSTTQGEEVAVLDDGSFWQPLHKNRITDCDGDALRLAVALGIKDPIRIDIGSVATTVEFDNSDALALENGADRNAATRRAIVRAAAEIGRTKKEAGK
jgi:hypothetical protein